LRFCKRELFHAIWLLALDLDFMHAYEHRMLIQCGDGVLQQMFPRVFTYSADYPEKVLLACVRYLAQCPCPRCLTQKTDIANMGSHANMLRRTKLRTDDHPVQYDISRIASNYFNIFAGATILIINIQSAFSIHLSPFGFDFYSMFVIDQMHEFELGVWKAIVTHLLCILYASGHNAIQRFNKRWAQYTATPKICFKDFMTFVDFVKFLRLGTIQFGNSAMTYLN
ncbi:uncharacterized protein LAESUDRAFT_668078, partial [Laetiporus sulphureus 93-53]